MVNEAETYVIDMEFAYFGPFGFDIGKIMANFMMAATSHLHRSAGSDYHDWLLDQAVEVWNVFAGRFLELWREAGDSAMVVDGLLTDDELEAYRQRFMQRLLGESVGFAACSLARRTLGIAGVADIRDIEDEELRAELEIVNLRLSKLLMARHRSIADIDEVSDLVRGVHAELPTDL
jgi:5-methylthioribose kinase